MTAFNEEYSNSEKTSIFFQPTIENSLNVLFTCYFNNFGVIMRSPEEMSLLYHMGCFGKGSSSRSKPLHHTKTNPIIMRKRQYDIRNSWYRKFILPHKQKVGDTYFKEVNEVIQQIKKDYSKQINRNVIDLVSSDDEELNKECRFEENEDIGYHDDTVIIVPNSDSDEDAESDYFKNLKPKCCLNRIKNDETLMLTFQEAFFLAFSLCCLQVINDSKKLNKEECWQLFTSVDHNFKEKYVVYHYFRCKGYIVKSGIKFGGDYVLYKEGPGISHSDYIVVIKYADTVLDWTTIFCLVRMATTTVKEILIAEVIPPCEEIILPEGLKHYTIKETIINRSLFKNDD